MAWRRYPNKYGNKKTFAYGIKFDSKHEAQRYVELMLMQDAGLIHDIELQKKFVLIPAQYEESDEVYKKGPKKGQKKRGQLLEHEAAYYADFAYYTKDGAYVVEDAKSEGTRTKEYRLKRKLMLSVHGIRIQEV